MVFFPILYHTALLILERFNYLDSGFLFSLCRSRMTCFGYTLNSNILPGNTTQPGWSWKFVQEDTEMILLMLCSSRAATVPKIEIPPGVIAIVYFQPSSNPLSISRLKPGTAVLESSLVVSLKAPPRIPFVSATCQKTYAAFIPSLCFLTGNWKSLGRCL